MNAESIASALAGVEPRPTQWDAATNLALSGIPVFPCAQNKQPLTKNGFKDASADFEQIQNWCDQYPAALIGVPTGEASGLLVVDVDPDGGQWHVENAARLECGRVHKTQRGHHLVYTHVPGIRCSASKVARGVDVRAEGGYTIWWPGEGLPVTGDLDDITPPPQWLLDLMSAPTEAREHLQSEKTGAHVVEGGRNAYLSREAFRLRKQGWQIEQIATALIAMNAARCNPPLSADEVQGIAGRKAAIEADPASSLELRVTKHGTIADEENVLRILRGDPDLQGIVRFDEFTGELLLSRPIDDTIVGERGVPRMWSDADTVTLQTHIQRRILPRIGRDKIESVIGMYARRYCAVHPVRDYLQSLEWDQQPRIKTWLRDYLGADSQPDEYLAGVGAKFLISAVARIMEPGCQVDSALVLEGLQGVGKSTARRVLAGDAYFSDSLPADLSHKDARDHLRGKWIIELSELAQFKRGEIETIKAFISRRHEQYRPSYGRHEIKFPRQCVFAGSTNADDYLVDQTGNRRFWVVACGDVDLQGLRRDRDQLWAEATHRYRMGEPWHLVGKLSDIAADQAQLRVAHDPWTSPVADLLMGRISGECTPGEVMALMDLPDHDRHKSNAGRVGQILRDLGWKKGQRHRTRGQIYVRA